MSTVAVNRKTIGKVETGVQTKRRGRARARAGSIALTRSIAFLSIAVASYFASSISGQIMIDQARRDAKDARLRFNTATRAVAGLESRVRVLKSTNGVETWALGHGFEQKELIPALDPLEGGTVVAQRD